MCLVDTRLGAGIRYAHMHVSLMCVYLPALHAAARTAHHTATLKPHRADLLRISRARDMMALLYYQYNVVLCGLSGRCRYRPMHEGEPPAAHLDPKYVLANPVNIYSVIKVL